MDRFATCCILRNWAFAATMVHTNLIYNITLLGLVFQSACCIGQVGWGRRVPVECRAGGAASSAP